MEPREKRRMYEQKAALEKLSREIHEREIADMREAIKNRPATMKFSRIGAREEWEKF